MANNRMYLRCKTCGQCLFLGKCFGGAYHTSNIYYDGKTHYVMDDDNGEDNAFLDKFNEFLQKHCYCCEDIEKSEYYEPKFVAPKNIEETCPENNFEIAYEFYYGGEE